MSYVIEKGIPLPPKPKRAGRAVGQLSEVTLAVGALQPGESLVCTAKSAGAIKSRVDYYCYGATPWRSEKRRFVCAPAGDNSYRIWRTA